MSPMVAGKHPQHRASGSESCSAHVINSEAHAVLPWHGLSANLPICLYFLFFLGCVCMCVGCSIKSYLFQCDWYFIENFEYNKNFVLADARLCSPKHWVNKEDGSVLTDSVENTHVYIISTDTHLSYILAHNTLVHYIHPSYTLAHHT